jgi:hypothetical protein
MTRHIKRHRDHQIQFGGDDISDEDDRHVIAILNYYEFLATSLEWGILDREVLMHTWCGPIKRAY